MFMQAKPSVLFVNKPHPLLVQRFADAGYHCDSEPDLPRDEIGKIIHAYYGMIINSRFMVDREFIDLATSLKFIGRLGSGMESIDVEYAENKGIRCFNSPEGNRDAVGEHALGLLLCVLNHICSADHSVRAGRWEREANRGVEIMGKTVAIIGYGNMGKAFAARLLGFGAEVIAYDKYLTGFSDRHAREVSMDDVFSTADIVSLHVPLTAETTGMCGDDFFERFNKNIFLINTSRGGVVNTASLVNNLERGKVRGAGLDVLEYEDISFETMIAKDVPEPMKYLRNSPKVVLTPHVAGWTIESKQKLAEVLADKILAEFPG